MLKNFKLIIALIIFSTLLLPSMGRADYLGQKVNFFVDPSYDLNKRERISAVLIGISSRVYFYLDDNWWSSESTFRQTEIRNTINFLAVEFEQKIYPTLISTFGSEWKPGIDRDERITILIHPMIEEAGGYFNSGDEYPRIQNPKSNEREMIYLNSQHLDKALLKSFLAHEFMHLITFNQKEILRKVSEETWLNEARAEYAPTLLGYDQIYEGSNLQRRVKIFLDKPSDSLTEWLNFRHDYGAVNLFTQYLVDHYGIKILVDSLHSSKIGISSINEALQKNGFKEDFSQIFTDWTIAVLIGDCKIGPRYCYLNPNLKNLRLVPQISFLPPVGESILTIVNTTKNWAGNWQKIIGGKNVLKLEFQGKPGIKFKVPYIVEGLEGNFTINFLSLDQNQKGTIYVSDFSAKNKSLTIIPSLQTKISDFNGLENSYQFSFTVSTVERTPEQETELIKNLLAQIVFLQKEIAKVQAQINAILSKRGQQGATPCRFENNLYYGMMNNSEVRCLQEFLKNQGPEIYPVGSVTGNFLSLTQAAVIRFQEKYAQDILVPLGLPSGTGYVGSATRAKINQLLGH